MLKFSELNLMERLMAAEGIFCFPIALGVVTMAISMVSVSPRRMEISSLEAHTVSVVVGAART